MKLKELLLSGLAIIGLSAVISVHAENIASQTFDDEQNLAAGKQTAYTDGIGDLRITYGGGGLGFAAAAYVSSGGPFSTTGGKLHAGHVSAFGVTFDGTGKYAPPGGLGFDNARSGFALFSAVDLSEYNSSTLTLDLATTIGGTSGDDDAMFVRLFLDGSPAGIDLLTMCSNANTTALAPDTIFAGGTLTYSIDNAVTNAQLFIGFAVDDDPDNYTVDNVQFDGTFVLTGTVLIIR
jgi:hypothetical protein